jgi:hypothetical protein
LIWQARASHKRLRVVRLETTSDGRRIVGLHIPNPALNAVLSGEKMCCRCTQGFQPCQCQQGNFCSIHPNSLLTFLMGTLTNIGQLFHVCHRFGWIAIQALKRAWGAGGVGTAHLPYLPVQCV